MTTINKITLYILLNILMLVIILIFTPMLNIVVYLSLFQIVYSIILIKSIQSKYLSTTILFLALSYVFHSGQALITAFGMNDIYIHKSVLMVTSYTLFINAIYFTMISHFFITLGMVLCKTKNITSQYLHDNETIMLNKLKKISIIMLLISIAPLIYLDFEKIHAVRNMGYLSTYETYSTGINKYISFIAQFARPSITMLLISYKNRYKIAKSIFIISSIYFIIAMLSGDRSSNLIYLLTNIFVYIKVIKLIKRKSLILYAIIGYLLLGLISTISIFRDSANFSFDSFMFYFKNRSSDGIVYSILREFGSTIKTLIYSMQFTKDYSEYNYGMTYVLSFLGLAPDLPDSLLHTITNNFTYTKSFPAQYQNSLGGSYLGELYYNFSWYGSIVAFIVGVLVRRVSDVIENSIKQKNWVYLSISMVLFPSLLLWVRGYFVEMLFKTFWIGIFVFILYNSFDKKKHISL